MNTTMTEEQFEERLIYLLENDEEVRKIIRQVIYGKGFLYKLLYWDWEK